MSEIKRFGRFEVQGVLGRGGMGTVHLANDPLIGRTVAIKEIRIDPSDDARERAELEERFKLEFRSAGKLSHPNIVTIYDVGQGGGSYFIAMEYVEGMSLSEYLKQNPKPPFDWICKQATQIGSGLDYAHQHNIVHRDIKPANVLLTRDHRPMITDFGLVKVLTSDLTMTGTVLGTPAFMSPEQVMGGSVEGSSDQFSFAVILYLMLTGDQPFAADHPSAILYKIVHEPPPRPQEVNHQLPSAIDQIMLRGLAKNSEDRYPDCSALAADLVSVLSEERTATLHQPGGPVTSIMGESLETEPLTQASRIVEQPTPPSGSDRSLVGPDAYSLPEALTPTPRSRHRPPSRSMKGLAAVAFLMLMALLGYFASSTLKRAKAVDEQPATESLPASDAARYSQLEHLLRIEAGQPGAAIRIDGQDSGQRVPSEVPLVGDEGQKLRLELVVGEEVVATRDVVLGLEPPPPWLPEPSSIELVVTSLPAGAAIRVNDRVIGTTPAEVSFSPGIRHALELALAGYEAASWSFHIEDLSPDQQDCRCLHFPLTSNVPPGFVTVTSKYPVTLMIDGRRHGPFKTGEVPVSPGNQQVTLVAEEVFLRHTIEVDVASGARVPIRVPKAVPVRITANPANCRVKIDGIDVDVTPINNRRIAVGAHEFSFYWPALDKTKTVRKTVTRARQRISETPN